MSHYRICRADGSFAGGEFAKWEHAHKWARQHCGAFWYVVETDRFGNRLASDFAGEEVSDDAPDGAREGFEE